MGDININKTSPILKIRNLKTYFNTIEGTVKAVDGVSIDLHLNETLGIVGESGSGKSVLVLSILRLIPEPPGKILEGDVIFDSKNLTKMPIAELRSIRGKEISMIFQDPMTSLNPVYTIQRQITENILLHTDMSKEAAIDHAISLLKKMGIPKPAEKMRYYPHQLSGGMRQRVMIAMALSCGPKILIADEPTTALDVTIQAQILKLMNQIKESTKSSIIIITHNLGIIARMAKNVAIMYAGKIVEYGDVSTIFYKAKHPYTLGLIKSIPRLDVDKEKLYYINGLPPSVLNMPTGCSFNPRCVHKKDICTKIPPRLKEIEKGHFVSCHLY